MKNYLYEDFQRLANSIPQIKAIRKSTVMITGATGFIGMLFVGFFCYLNQKINAQINIVVYVRNKEKAEMLFKNIPIEVVVGDISDKINYSGNVDYIIHCASNTDSKLMVDEPVECINGIVNGTQAVCEFAVAKNVKSMVYLSSMEIYGNIEGMVDKVSEENVGKIDLLNKRSCYPLGKRMAENICYCFSQEYQCPIKIARLSQTFGAGYVLGNSSKIFAYIGQCILNQRNIILHTDGSSMGNYVYSADAISGLMYILVDGGIGEAYNVANEELTMTIREMAEFVIKNFNNGVSIVYDIPKENVFGYSTKTNIKLSSQKLQKIGWSPQYNMKDMYQRMLGV